MGTLGCFPPFVDADIDALEAWEIETGDSTLIVAILDTGFPYDFANGVYCHRDLRDSLGTRYTLGYNCTDSELGCVPCDTLPCTCLDLFRHGACVTGITAAVTNNDAGIAGIIWGGEIYIIKLFTGDGDTTGLMWNMAIAIDSAVSYGAMIINISGGLQGVYNRLAASVYRAYLANSLIVAAAGSGYGAYMDMPAGFATWADTIFDCCDPEACDNYPDSCGFRNVISVTCSGSWGTAPHKCAYGKDSVKVVVVAPNGVYTTANVRITWPCEDYFFFGGSSASTPHVTGVAALLHSHAFSQNDTLTPDSIRTLIEVTADDVEAPGFDDSTGFGRVNALRALMAMEGYYPNATGYLWTNATWGDTLGDTLYVLGDIVVPQGCTLTVDEGAVVRFLTNDREDFGDDSTRCEIIVQGSLIVEGNDTNWVSFMSDSSNPGDSDWYGIKVDSAGTIDLNYCSIQHALEPILWDSTDAYTLNHVEFRRCHTWPTVDSGHTLELNTVGFADFDNAITVNANGVLKLDSCEFNTGDTAVVVKFAGSANIKNSEIANVHTGIHFSNSADDTVIGCVFRDNSVQGILVNNDGLIIDGCTFVDSSDSGKYGILCKRSITIKNSFFEGYKYGIKVEGQTKFSGSSPVIEECGFYNIRESGVYSISSSSPTIKKSCFKGSYGQAGIHIHEGNPYISHCYMASENDEIPIGILFTGGAEGKVLRTTIWDYNSSAVETDPLTDPFPNFGDADTAGNNWFEEPDSGEYYFASFSDSTVLARYNHWDVDDGDSSSVRNGMIGDVVIDSILGVCHYSPYYSEQCSDLPPSDPFFEPCNPQKPIAIQEGEEDPAINPLCFKLSQNYPNPFNPQTVIKYDLPDPARVKLTIFNVLGQQVRTLVDREQEAGSKTLLWEGTDDQGQEVASGVYFFRLQAGKFEATKRMVLVR